MAIGNGGIGNGEMGEYMINGEEMREGEVGSSGGRGEEEEEWEEEEEEEKGEAYDKAPKITE